MFCGLSQSIHELLSLMCIGYIFEIIRIEYLVIRVIPFILSSYLEFFAFLKFFLQKTFDLPRSSFNIHQAVENLKKIPRMIEIIRDTCNKGIFIFFINFAG